MLSIYLIVVVQSWKSTTLKMMNGIKDVFLILFILNTFHRYFDRSEFRPKNKHTHNLKDEIKESVLTFKLDFYSYKIC